MAQHVIVGAGTIGGGVARRLVEDGHTVRMVTRSGSGPDLSGVERVAADAADADRLTDLSRGAAVIYNCANPPYHRWTTDWPPIAAALLAAAESSGAVLVTMSNLYGYGPVDSPMTENTPLRSAPGTKGAVRNRMWLDALAAHDAGRIRVTEARASDFYGPGIRGTGHLGDQFVPRLLAGRKPRIAQGDPDAPHSWTNVGDVARTLIRLGGDERAWGRAWHVPTDRALSVRQVATQMAKVAGVRDPGVQVLPRLAIRLGGLAVPFLRELPEVRYQFAAPFVMDSSAAQTTFDLPFTPFEQGLTETVGWWREQERVAA
ncbi:MAG: NAD-dependent epimerase/dehydratase family protein [Pseudonocardia sp.]|nr:NAD-dependent epimerase/dehydratase family protein [Pseudonocardia sp.]